MSVFPLPPQGSSVIMTGTPEGFDAFVLKDLMAKCPMLLHITRDEERMMQLEAHLRFLLPHHRILTFPAWDCLPYDRLSPRTDVMAERLATLSALSNPPGPFCILTTVAAVLQRTPPKELLRDITFTCQVDQPLNVDQLIHFLTQSGYVRVGTVREPGEFAIRGGLIDLYPSGEQYPLRLDLFGEVIERINPFDPMTQRRAEENRAVLVLHSASEVVLTPNAITRFRHEYQKEFGAVKSDDLFYASISEGKKHAGMEHWLPLFYPRLNTLLDFMPAETLLTQDYQTPHALAARLEQIGEHFQSRADFSGLSKTAEVGGVYHPLPIDALYVSLTEFDAHLKRKTSIEFTPYAHTEENASLRTDAGGRKILNLASARADTKQNIFDVVNTQIKVWQQEKKRVLIACYSAGSCERLQMLLKEHGITKTQQVTSWPEFEDIPLSQTGIACLPIEDGFVSEAIAVLTEQDILGERISRPQKQKRRSDLLVTEADALSVGDIVVHIDHGIGKYQGLQTLDIGGAAHDCLQVVYDGGDKLFVPVENIEVLSRYGAEGNQATLDKLGSTAWQARKARVTKRIKEMADELIKIAAARQTTPADRYEKPEGSFDEFCARFPYPETEDQLKSIDHVLSDLEAGYPMDRLICGDVGFGKTEVALRAAFMVASTGKQVAVIVPTTLLCRQHYLNFSARFKEFGIRVEQLSRLVTPKEATNIKATIADGKTQVVVGTHAILSKTVAFQNLGLVIVDEEQHFGVAQKERLKHLKTNVHVLTLTATPIPRTLQMALSGVRELSLIATPPVDRLAVRTFVLPFDGVTIREAILRELYRGGQTFYVCPRIEHLESVHKTLTTLVPEASVALVNGQMPARQLEQIMTRFYEEAFDVLLSTNIIESGIDISTANTLIVHRADMFGLSQLYQLRGRVGRSKLRAYAYLTLPANKPINPQAQKRLEVMQTLDNLGAGFQLASHDMDIRGAGNLLGDQQSGHIKEVGAELYQHMLEEAIAEIRQEEKEEAGVGTSPSAWTPQINLGLPILIPETYVTDLSVRLGLYRRISTLSEEKEMEAFAVELIDRFGSLPDEVQNLLSVIALKQLCRMAGISKLDAGDKGATITFYKNTFSNPPGLIEYINLQHGSAKVRPDQKIVLMRPWKQLSARVKGVKRVLGDLVHIASAG